MKNWMFFLLLMFCFSISSYSQETGFASFYANKFNGKKTASGIVHNNEDYVAAHRNLPFGTFVRVTNVRNNKEVIVRITDRGPFLRKRVIDLSRSAAEKIGMVQKGIAEVKIDIIGVPADLNIAKMLELKISLLDLTYVPPVIDLLLAKEG